MRWGFSGRMSRGDLFREVRRWVPELSQLDYTALERRVLGQLSGWLKQHAGSIEARRDLFGLPRWAPVYPARDYSRVKKGRGQRRNRRNR